MEVIELPSLYEHQQDMVARLRNAMAVHPCNILQAPPGTGKTRIAKWIIGKSVQRGVSEGQSGRSLFAVHRRSLVDNASDSFNESPVLRHGLVMSQRDTDWRHPVSVASIDSLLSWYVEHGKYQVGTTFDLVAFDECHSHLQKFIKFIVPHNQKRKELGLKPAFVIGLSATPEAKAIPKLFGSIVQGPKTQWLIDNGFLSPFRYVQATTGRLEKLVMRGGEYTKDSNSAAFEGMAGDLVRDWKKWAEGRPTVGFFTRLSQAREACELLNENGINAAYVDGATPDEQRHQLFEQLGEGVIDYLCNVGVVERGTNIPNIRCVQLCTAVGSRVRYLQMIGRGSRTSPDKTDCLVLDHANCIRNNGFFEDDIEWIIDNSRSKVKDHEGRPTIECPQCQRIYRGGRCVCGYEPTRGERRSQGLDFNGQELVEIKKQPQKESKKQSFEEIMIRALYMAGRSERTWKQAVGIAYSLAKKQGQKMKIPREVVVAGQTYKMLPYGHDDQNRRVKHLFPFTK